MADSKISALPASTTPLAGTEVLPIVQSSTTKQVSVANLTAGRTFDALGMTLTSTDAGASAAPLLDLYRDSATPAASDTLGEIEFNGEDSAGNKQQYALIHASILSPTSTAEAGQIHFETATAGASTEKMIIGTSNLVVNDIGAVYNVRIEGDTDANLFYTDATNDRVGVGTISPATKLQVNGTVTATSLLVGSATATANFNFNASQSADTTAGGMVENTSNTASATAVMRYKNSGSTFAYTGLGSPTRDVYAGLGPNVLAMYTGSTAGIAFSVDAAGPIKFVTNSTQRMQIDSSGIVTMDAYGAGAATFSAAGVISSVSDETWKTKDGVPTNPDVMLQKLEPGYWFYNDEKKETFGQDRQLGFYAQNVHEAIGEEAAPTPETFVDKDENGNEVTKTKPWGYYDRSVLAITVMSLKNALDTIEELKQRLTALEKA